MTTREGSEGQVYSTEETKLVKVQVRLNRRNMERVLTDDNLARQQMLGIARLGAEHARVLAPVKTGALRDSIWYGVAAAKNGEPVAQVGATVPYAIYQELGTRFVPASPFLRPALHVTIGRVGLEARGSYTVLRGFHGGASVYYDERALWGRGRYYHPAGPRVTGTLIPSATVTLREWMVTNPAIAALVGERVSSVMPLEGLAYPWVTLQRITGLPQLPEASIDTARVQINVWGGRKENGLPDWAAADLVARTIAAEVRVFNGEELGDAYLIDLDELEGMQQLVDPDTGEARFWMDVVAIIRRTDGN